MSDSTDRSSRAKQDFYARPDIASAYEEQRFGGASGAWVSAREMELVLRLLPTFRRALDLGCGTGRLSRALGARGAVVGIDTSAAMLAAARGGNPAPWVQGDAFRLPFADASFDAVVALRLVFHFRELGALLGEARRIVRRGGVIVFDTYVWSVRAWLPLDPARWGGGVFAHSPAQVERAAAEAGWKVAQREACFLFSPYVYRRLPLPVVRGLAQVEGYVPARLRARVFWALERDG